MSRITVEGVVATTHAIPGRGGRLTPDILANMVARFTPGMPIFRQHGATRIGEWHSAELRRRHDGEFEIYAEGVVDLPDGETVESYVGKGLSVAFTEPVEVQGDELVLVGIDSIAFEDIGLARAKAAFGAASDRVAPTWYHQFAEVPPPTVLIQLMDNAVPILQGAAGAAL